MNEIPGEALIFFFLGGGGESQIFQIEHVIVMNFSWYWHTQISFQYV